uniref:Cation efflux protein cytoplasmic domain-containing protein n=1 Tax=Chlamydomonas euryale TaxID=1486919 RepID=A0A7R9YSA6_9CHLO|mmetsp:Transcript_19794/g.58728  ORF Transcript_19794/g.58728 Transcript_19794/m.58728 type:complete len:436 (+) Transcript_19794:649-1956(+)
MRSPAACELNDTCYLSSGTTHGQGSQSIRVQRKLVAACILCFIFMVVEAVGGYIAKSVSIMSDAAHMLSDVAGLSVSIFAAWAVTRRSHISYSFGYHRAEILGALLSILVIWAVTGALVWEAVQRIITPQIVDGKLMFFIATAGVVFNLIVGSVLGHSHLGGSHAGCSHDHGGGSHDHGAGGASHEHGAGGGCGGNHGASDASHKHAHGHEHSHRDAHGHEDRGHSHDHAHEDTGHGHDHGCTKARNGKDPEQGLALHDGHAHGHGQATHDHDHHGHRHGGSDADNINLRSAMLHVVGDLVQSSGVAFAGLLIWTHQDDVRWQIADPICTFIFAVIVLFTTVSIIRDITHTLMERAPVDVDMEALLSDLHAIDGVLDVHDLHVWNISSGVEPILTAHVHSMDDAAPAEVLDRLEAHARAMGIKHSTFQICNPSAS